MNVEVKGIDTGIVVKFQGKKYHLRYPGKIWKNYPKSVKGALVDNLSFLLTVNMPLVAGFDKLDYNTSLPLFKSIFSEMVTRGIPGSVEDYKHEDTGKLIKKFFNVKYNFSDYNIKSPSYSGRTGERAVLPFSSGKDSTLSAAVCKEIGLNPVLVYINDTVSPLENKMKIENTMRVAKKNKLDYVIVENSIEKLNDFETWNKKETCLSYMHMVTSFCFIALPIANYFNSKYIVVGNEQDLNYTFLNKDGYITFPSFDQITEWAKQQDAMIKQMTNNKTGVMSVIESVEDTLLFKILISRYPEFAKNIISCYSIDNSKKKWCCDCPLCASYYMMILAGGGKPKEFGFHSNMLDKKYKDYYSVFNGKKLDVYLKTQDAKDSQMLEFLLAYRNDAKGYLMDKFKKKFLKEALGREDKLRKKVFKLYNPATLPNKIKKQVLSIYREEMGKR